MGEWLVQLSGDKLDLRALTSYLRTSDLTIEEDKNDWYLKSPTFNRLSDAEDIRAKAVDLIRVINGIARVVNTGSKKVSLNSVAYIDDSGKKEFFISLDGELEPNGRLYAPEISQNDAPDQPTLFDRWMEVANQDNDVNDALHYFAYDERNWYDLYKVFELVSKDVGSGSKNKGESKMVSNTWSTRKEIKRFRQSANYHRHAREKLPPNPMTIKEAETLIRDIVTKWVAEKV